MNNLYRFLGISTIASVLFACGGDNVTNIYEPGMDVIAAGDALPKCNADNQGKLVFSSDSGRAFFCNQGKWNVFVGEADKGEKGADGKSCTARSIKEGVEISCGKDIIDTLVNGKNGKDGVGKDGKDGNDGMNCTARSIDEGVEISCGKDIIDTLVNGKNGKDGVGKDGKDGENCSAKPIEEGYEISCGKNVVGILRHGESSSAIGGCSISSDKNGIVVLDCDGKKTTIYKAECNGVPFDPTNSFCLAGNVTPLEGMCGEKKIDLTKQFCDTKNNKAYRYTVIQYNGNQQIWMAEDLSNELYSWYDAVGATGGVVKIEYDFYQGICPDGWHIPTYKDIFDLANFDGKLINGSTNIAGAIALKSSEEESWPNVQIGENEWAGPGSDEFGFSALPNGYYDSGAGEPREGIFNMWSSESSDNDNACVLQMDAASNQIRIIDNFKKVNKTSVRCIKNY